MKRGDSLKLRMVVDVVLVCTMAFVAPIMLAPIGRSWGVLAAGFAAFLLAIGFLLDGLRTLQRLRKLHLSHPTTAL